MSNHFIRGTFERSLQINYRVDPRLLAKQLAPGMRPLLVRGQGIAGIALVRISELRPSFLPGWLGVRSEHAVHWVAIESEVNGESVPGAWIARHDTDLRLSAVRGGMFGAGGHHARFELSEAPTHVRASVHGDDGAMRIELEAGVCDQLRRDSVFATANDAADVFLQDPRIATLRSARHRGDAEPLRIVHVGSSYLDDPSRFPRGSVALDSAVILRRLRRISEPAVQHARRHLLSATAPSY
jgi:hypothetical protein